MSRIAIPFGETYISSTKLDDADLIMPTDMEALENPRKQIKDSLENPINSQPLFEVCRGKDSIVIVINDITRPSPTDLFVEEMLKQLEKVGVQDEQVTLLVALGNHRPNTDDELRGMVGDEVFNRIKIVNHQAENQEHLVYLGDTKRGLPIIVNKLVAEADITILTGIITPHQSAGYSGGRKSIMPGVAGIDALKRHHSFPIRSYSPIMGQLDDNPFHEESLEAAKKVGVDFIINVVKNSRKEIVSVVAGELEGAHEEGVRICDESWKVKVPERYDIVVTSPGGYPKDFDLHQSQKAMPPAEVVTKEGGVIILVAECRDGVGKFAKWLQDAAQPQDVIDAFEKVGFTPDHSSKAFMLARALKHYEIILVNPNIEKELVEDMFFKYAKTLDEAIDQAEEIIGEDNKKLAIPYAVDCIPQPI
ncbi:nickel-dependent lactate racemase [Alkalibacillus aidingensis]|uniref:nickel-dependent lactate racemase n=1 Tax=Alkalibacillus aidingensis TaxID=2747607 RepID=UPI0016604C83|nr:nickel-dependent lactate racemase [Alkalibacillus aidingensis]